MEFKDFKKIFQENFSKLTANADALFQIDLDKDGLWKLYLDSFPEGSNPMYRTRREYDCGCCRHFVKTMGGTVVIENGKAKSIWNFETGEPVFQPVIDALNQFVTSKPVQDVFLSRFNTVGIDKNFEKTEGEIKEWEHFFLKIPAKFVNTSGKSDAEVKGEYKTTRNVFKRSLDEITQESVLTVLELIAQNSLYKGEEWNPALNIFLTLKKEYDELKTAQEKENYAWEKSIKVGAVVGRIKNHSMGTLLLDISEGTELDIAVKKYEVIVAPTNYKRPNAIFTKKMLEEAKETLKKLGYMKSLNRRYATLDDITVNNILFSNRDSAKRIKGDVFDELAESTPVNPKKFSKVEEVSVQDFISDVLPTAREIELYLENKHSGNFVSLIAPEDTDAPSMFKWNNAFSWAYAGNITDSVMKERVKSAGGNVEGVLRFSIEWNDGIAHDGNDLDAHCFEPTGNEIFYARMHNVSTSGVLDVDVRYPIQGVPAVENITWSEKRLMRAGTYQFFVHQFANRGGRNGFKAEIEFDGQIHSFEYNKELKQDEKVYVATVVLKDGQFTLTEMLPSTVSSREIWNLKTNQFIPVSVVMFSPNYWDEQDGIGNRHYFFMLKNCINSENPNGFYNEFLKEDLLKHKRVFEALGGKMRVAGKEDQLSGLGFSSTLRNEVIVKVIGQSERVIKIKI